MPVVRQFKKDSVIYFRGEMGKQIYTLKVGAVRLIFPEKSQEKVQQGEFFGVHSVIGNYPREEDARAVTDIQVIVFTLEEFEDIIRQNKRMALQFLRVLSHDLRNEHLHLQKITNSSNDADDPAEGLFWYAQNYINNSEYQKAEYVLTRILEQYPIHLRIDDAKKILSEIKHKESKKT